MKSNTLLIVIVVAGFILFSTVFSGPAEETQPAGTDGQPFGFGNRFASIFGLGQSADQPSIVRATTVPKSTRIARSPKLTPADKLSVTSKGRPQTKAAAAVAMPSPGWRFRQSP